MCRLCHVGSTIFSQARYDFSRNSSIHSGSPFFAEIARTTSSLRPGGKVSDSRMVSKPYLYSRVASCSMVSSEVDIIFCVFSFFHSRGAPPPRACLSDAQRPLRACVCFFLVRLGPHPQALVFR